VPYSAKACARTRKLILHSSRAVPGGCSLETFGNTPMKIPIAVGLICCLTVGILFLIRSRNNRQPTAPTPRVYSENEGWIVHRGGEVSEKKAKSGLESLNSWERLAYCVYITDYMMRNAGDFANAAVMYPDFQKDGKRFAKELSLPATSEAFSLSERKLQREYFDRFEAICNELKKADPGASPNGGPATPSGNSEASGGRHR
jgi:hypothetical protein